MKSTQAEMQLEPRPVIVGSAQHFPHPVPADDAGAEDRRRLGEKLLLLANAVTLLRLALSIALIPVYELAGSAANPTAFAIVCLIWLSDIADGRIARAGHRRGALARRDGQALDPLVDDFAYAAGFLVLFSAGAVAMWFVALVILSRCLFAIVRMVGLSQSKPFASPRPATKLKGVAFGGGQIALFAALAWPESTIGANSANDLPIWVMTAVCLVAIAEFVVRVNWKVLRDLFRTDQPRVIEAVHQAAPRKLAAVDSPQPARRAVSPPSTVTQAPVT